MLMIPKTEWYLLRNSQRGKVLQLFSFPMSFEISLLIFTSARHNSLLSAQTEMLARVVFESVLL